MSFGKLMTVVELAVLFFCVLSLGSVLLFGKTFVTYVFVGLLVFCIFLGMGFIVFDIIVNWEDL